MKKSLKIFTLLLSASALAAPLKPLKLVLNWKPEAEFGGFYEGKIKKIFEKHGFDLTIIPGGPGTPVSQMLESGAVDLGTVSADDIVMARARGLSLKALFTVYQEYPQGVMIHEERKIDSFEKLFESEGEIALQRGLAFTTFLTQKYGKKAKAKVVPYVGGIGPFEKNPLYSQQCFVTSEPIAAKRLGIKVSVLGVSKSGFNPYTTVVTAKDEWISSHKDILKKLYLALSESWKSYLKNPTECNKFMQKLNPGLDLATFTESSEIQKPYILKDEALSVAMGAMTTQRWAELAEQMKSMGLAPKIETDAQNYFVPIWK